MIVLANTCTSTYRIWELIFLHLFTELFRREFSSLLRILKLLSQHKKATINQVATMLAASKNVRLTLCLGEN